MGFDTNDLLAALLHELKNNLALLSMTLEGIPRQGAAEHDQPLDAARLQCRQVSERLHQTLLLYKMDNRRLALDVDAHSPVDFAQELAGTAKSLSAGRLHVEIAVDPDVPALWFFDRNLVEMAMMNAVHNALAYAGNRVTIHLGMENGQLGITVRDDSKGYPEHILQSEDEDKPYPSKGTGLGLLLSRMIARAHVNEGRTGSLRLGNDHGAVFTVLLP